MIYGLLKFTMGLRLTQEEEYEGADLSIHRIGANTIRINTPDHLPPHVHVVLADRRDAMVMLDSLQVVSRTVRASEIKAEVEWIAANRAKVRKMFKECNP